MAIRKTPARKRRSTKKRSTTRRASTAGTTRRKSTRRRSTTARRTSTARKAPRRRRGSSSSRKLSPIGFLKGILKGLRKDWPVYALAVILAAAAYAASPGRTNAGKPSQAWTKWAMALAVSLGGSYIAGRFLPKFISKEQALKAAVLASLGLAFYAGIRGALMRVPGVKQLAETGEKLGAKLAPKNAVYTGGPPVVRTVEGTSGWNQTRLRRVPGIGDGRMTNTSQRLRA